MIVESKVLIPRNDAPPPWRGMDIMLHGLKCTVVGVQEDDDGPGYVVLILGLEPGDLN